jgi:hypothetical protein
MKKYYGNYLGMVIDNNDPEFRGRVQIFIPHILPAIYKGWNETGENITISCVGDNIPQGLTADVVDKLKKVLPWAEAASPIVGTSSPGGIMAAIGSAVEAVGGAIAGAATAVGNYFDQSPTTIPDGSLPPGSDLQIPIEEKVTTKGLVPAFTQRLNGFYQEATSLGYKITCSSAFRSPSTQISLYKGSGGYQKPDGSWAGGNGSVAKPGGSSHEFGIAVDLKTTGNGVSITEISAAKDRSSNRDTPAYRDLLRKYGLHQPLHPEVYGSGVPEKWHVEPIEMPGWTGQRAGAAKVVAARLASSGPSTELPNSSQLPPTPNPLVSSSPSNTSTAEPTSPTTGLVQPVPAAPAPTAPAPAAPAPTAPAPAAPAPTAPAPTAPAPTAPAPALSVAPPGQGGIQGTISGGGTASDGIAKLAADRTARFSEELKDKHLLDRIEWVMQKEAGALGVLVFETAVNRAFFDNRTLKRVMFEKGYWRDPKQGDPDATKTIPHTNLALNAVKDVIYNGANVTDLATDNGYNSWVGTYMGEPINDYFMRYFIKKGVTGSWYDLGKKGQKITDPAEVARHTNSKGNGMVEFLYRKDGHGNGSSTSGKNARAYAEKYNIKPTIPSSFDAKTPLPPDVGTSNLTGEPLNTSQDPQTVMNTDPHGPTVIKNTNDCAKGLFTFPGPGAMVWVFFREGNPLYPVYFAASYSAGEWKSAYGGASMNPEGTNNGTVGTQTANSMKLNPNGAGGIEITHVKDVSDPTGAKDKANVMLYSEDGSNMLFSKGYHQIYTRHDRRDKIDGKLYKTVGGTEEKWIEDDSNLNVRGNVFVKIGKIDKETVEAMKQLQDFSKQMNDTLMQNAGEEKPPEEKPAEGAAAGTTPNPDGSTTTNADGKTVTTSSTTTQSNTSSSSTSSSSSSTVKTTQTSQTFNSGGGSTTTYADIDEGAQQAAADREAAKRAEAKRTGKRRVSAKDFQ